MMSVLIGPIAVAKALTDFNSAEDNYISFKKGDQILVFSKTFGDDVPVWGGNVVRNIEFKNIAKAKI